jgi:uncharacterized repeat protein (TIGR03806 family)
MIRLGLQSAAIALLGFVLAACEPPKVTLHSPEAYPQRLSEWGLMALDGKQLTISQQTLVYHLNTPLFSDYALKLRTLYLPEGTQGSYHPEDTFALPVGSIISKTFFYPKDENGDLLITADWSGDPGVIQTDDYRLIETRLLVRQPHGWDALPYVWKGSDAYLNLTGSIHKLTLAGGAPLNYLVPSKNQCASCHATNHTTKALQPIGIKARHVDRKSPVSNANQLDLWAARGWLDQRGDQHRPNAQWNDDGASLAHRARSYLDINCGHCHNQVGAADTSGLLLDYKDHPMEAMGQCKPPIAAGRGSGGLLYSIVPGEAEASILSFRLVTNDPGMLMPELGRSMTHTEGVDLINRWIDGLTGRCL